MMECLSFAGFGGLRLAADAFGPVGAPVTLLIAPAGLTKEYWHSSARALGDAGRRAICVDLRGHGESAYAAEGGYAFNAYVGDLRAILSALQTRASVIASGLGAMAAIAAVGEGDPHLVSALALVDATIWINPDRMQQLRQAMNLRAEDFASAESALNSVAALHSDLPGRVASDRVLTAFTRTDEGRYRWRVDTNMLKQSGLEDEVDRLVSAARRISAPTTLICGSRNDGISPEKTKELAGLIAGSEIAELEGGGNFLAADQEDWFNAVVLDFLERHAPRQPVSYIGGAEPRLLRDVLGCFSTGVTIVTTTNSVGDPIGLTANSFTSVSLDPPLILFALAKSSTNKEAFIETERFAVNVLHIGQQPAASAFARRGEPRFENVAWEMRGGAPILKNSLASLDCTKTAVHDGGDHLIFVGQVRQAWFEPHRDPLLYFRGKFRRLHLA